MKVLGQATPPHHHIQQLTSSSGMMAAVFQPWCKMGSYSMRGGDGDGENEGGEGMERGRMKGEGG